MGEVIFLRIGVVAALRIVRAVCRHDLEPRIDDVFVIAVRQRDPVRRTTVEEVVIAAVRQEIGVALLLFFLALVRLFHCFALDGGCLLVRGEPVIGGCRVAADFFRLGVI